jgi:sodium/bile acid cotransporter 7
MTRWLTGGLAYGRAVCETPPTMISALGKRWFLLLLLGCLAIAWLRPDWLRPVTARLEPLAVVAVALFLMAWSLESRSLYQALLRPLPALWAVLISYGLLPLLAWLSGWLLESASFRLGLLLIASVPCTLASAVLWTRMAGGDEATALLTILLTTLASWAITPAWLAWGAGTLVELDVPAMMRGLALVLIVPVGLGQASRAVRVLAQTAVRLKPILGIIAQLLILTIVLKAAVDVSDRLAETSLPVSFGSYGRIALLCVSTHLAALLTGLTSSRLLGFTRPHWIGVAFACSQKTLPVALYLFDGYFVRTHPLAVVPLVFYHVGQLIVDTVIAERLARAQPTGLLKPSATPAKGKLP